jgi:hypothetical protein
MAKGKKGPSKASLRKQAEAARDMAIRRRGRQPMAPAKA